MLTLARSTSIDRLAAAGKIRHPPDLLVPPHRIGAGIPIRIHVTFWLLLFWVAAMAPSWGQPASTLLVIVTGLFGCIVLHELGHALTAKAFGIRARDITLYPIGGISSFENVGNPRQEMLIALAGPAVNLQSRPR
jgi:Zn-dependent protease